MPGAMLQLLTLLALVETVFIHPALADATDWVNVNYVIQSKNTAQSNTLFARNSIINSAGSTARKGPWSVTNSKGIAPPSGDAHDYLSWAPYHWPNCNWCPRGTTHLAHNNTDDAGGDGSDGSDPTMDPSPKDSNDPNSSDSYSDGDQGGYDPEGFKRSIPETVASSDSVQSFEVPAAHLRMIRVKRALPDDTNSHTVSLVPLSLSLSPDVASQLPASVFDATSVATNIASVPEIPIGGPPPLPTQSPSVTTPTPGIGPGTTDKVVSGTLAPPQAAAKTKQDACTPSPTKSLPPSATWTTCPYVVRDGRVNPDVRSLNGPAALNSLSQSVIYNAVAYALVETLTYSQNAASFIDAFFLSASTRMNPNMNFGQLVRGLGKAGQMGTFTGILDARGMVMIANGILVLKAAHSPDWTTTRDKEMNVWTTQYTDWLQSSDLGKKTASRPNNHATFYISQLSATMLLIGDSSGSAAALQSYFHNQFLDQIATSGEQPFEAIRTRPYHYRCFNLEAMIANAKLGDQLGLNFWTAKSKYGATIQTALDYTMALDPKEEDATEILPHVASIAAAYGDPKGKYEAFLKKTMADYQNKPYWFYDQTGALLHSPAALVGHKKRSVKWSKEDIASSANETATTTDGAPSLGGQTDPIPFQCPAVFNDAQEVEVSDGIFVTCGDVKPFYEISAIVGSSSAGM